MKIKGQASTLAISIAVLASFLSGAVAFSQMQLIPEMFEKRTNDLDMMTRAESRGENTAGNFMTRAAWYDLSDITYDLGQETGVGDNVGSYYEGGLGTGDNGDEYAKSLREEYFREVEQRLSDRFDDYSTPDGSNSLSYSKCDVSIDPNVDVSYGVDTRNPYIESADGDGLVTVDCTGSELDVVYKPSGGGYDIRMGSNRFPIMVKLLAAGMFENTQDSNNGAEEEADRQERGGELSPRAVGTQPGYWNDNGYDAWTTDTSDGQCEETKSQAISDAKTAAKDSIAYNHMNTPGPRIADKAHNAMDTLAGGSRICLLGACSPELPGDFDWDDLEFSTTIIDQGWDKEAKKISDAKYNHYLGPSCRCQNPAVSAGSPCDDVNKTYAAEATARWHYDFMKMRIKVTETSNANKIPTDSGGWQTLVVKDIFYRDFGEPSWSDWS